mgnify:FL=1
MKHIGTVVRGIKTPIITKNMNLKEVVVNSLLDASIEANFSFNDKDVVAITESVVARCENNYVNMDDICYDIKRKFHTNHIGLVFPTPVSRNRFSLILKGIARAMDKITMLLSYPDDEVGNCLFDPNLVYENNLNPFTDVLNEKEYRNYFKEATHIFTGVDYVKYFRDVCERENCEIEYVFTTNPLEILNYTKDVLVCNIHNRQRTKEILKNNGAKSVYGTDDILTESINGSGFNPKYGLLGSNMATDETLKLFPKDGEKLVYEIQEMLKEKTNKNIEVMVYGDGAFKDPVGKIWELADPVVSPFYTKGLEGTPNELKLKYLADNKYNSLNGEKLNKALEEEIKNKNKNLVGKNVSLGTTPRRYTDLLGSLADLTSGSGDKGTPVVLIQHYFDNYSD